MEERFSKISIPHSTHPSIICSFPPLEVKSAIKYWSQKEVFSPPSQVRPSIQTVPSSGSRLTRQRLVPTARTSDGIIEAIELSAHPFALGVQCTRNVCTVLLLSCVICLLHLSLPAANNLFCQPLLLQFLVIAPTPAIWYDIQRHFKQQNKNRKEDFKLFFPGNHYNK